MAATHNASGPEWRRCSVAWPVSSTSAKRHPAHNALVPSYDSGFLVVTRKHRNSMLFAAPPYLCSGEGQQAASSQKTHVSRFRQVLARHGLTMASIAIICLLLPSIQTALLSSLDNLFRNPLKYLLWSLLVATFIFVFLRYTKREIDLRQLIWIAYLFMISVVEEIAFRLSLPLLISSDVSGISFFWIGALISNLLFATIHYFTLRWKLNACIFTFLGCNSNSSSFKAFLYALSPLT